MMMIKVRQTDRQLYACAKRAQSDFMARNIARNTNGILKSEIEYLYPGKMAAVSRGKC